MLMVKHWDNYALRLILIILGVSALITFSFVHNNRSTIQIIDKSATGNKNTDTYDKSKVFNEYILFLRMFSGKRDIFYNNFLDTFKFFWPFHSLQANLIIVLDDESNLDHQWETELSETFARELANELQANQFNFWITFEQANDTIYHTFGWNRQQWSMFWCDKFLDRLNISNRFKYIGFVDTDAVFTSLITPESIFNNPSNLYNPKPIIITYLGFGRGRLWQQVSRNTLKWFGKTELFKHMSQFPVSYKISHIKEFRLKTVQYWFGNDFMNHNFDEVVHELTKPCGDHRKGSCFSQFNIFATYVWYHAQDQYEWYFEKSQPGQWEVRKKMYNITKNDNEILNYSSSNVHNAQTEPMVRIALHVTYSWVTKHEIIAKGYCFSINWKSKYCRNLNATINVRDGLYTQLFEFESKNHGHVWLLNDYLKQQSLIAQEKYYKQVDEIISNHHWHKPLIPICQASDVECTKLNVTEYIKLIMLKHCQC